MTGSARQQAGRVLCPPLPKTGLRIAGLPGAGLLMAALALSGCGAPSQRPSAFHLPSCRMSGTTPQRSITLAFGLTRPGGQSVTPDEWIGFLNDVVTPLFPAGLTVTDGAGQWRDPKTGRITSESAHLVWIVASDSPDLSARIATIRRTYRQRFDQQSVGLFLHAGCASF